MKKGRGFGNAEKEKESLGAWEEDDYEANQRKLQLFAERQVACRKIDSSQMLTLK